MVFLRAAECHTVVRKWGAHNGHRDLNDSCHPRFRRGDGCHRWCGGSAPGVKVEARHCRCQYDAVVRAFDAVLFDFGHTLFDTIAPDACTAEFRRESGVDIDPAAFAAAWATIRERSRQPDELAKGRDLSAEAHQRGWLESARTTRPAGRGLAEFTYGLECSARGWRPYPDTEIVLAELHRREIPIGVVSDCGWDIRAVFDAHGIRGLIDAFDLSYEHGACKPDPRLFESACSKLDVEPAKTLMVGDSWLTDGGAAAVGITDTHPPRSRADDLPRALDGARPDADAPHLRCSADNRGWSPVVGLTRRFTVPVWDDPVDVTV